MIDNLDKAADGEMEHITARVESHLAEALRRRAELNDRSLSAELRQALRFYLGEESAK